MKTRYTALPNLRDLLLESDRRYFEAGAIRIPIEGAEIVYLKGLESLAAGCVIQQLQPTHIHRSWTHWLTAVEGRLRSLGMAACRLYTDELPLEFEAVLTAQGYHPQIEVGLVSAMLTPDTPGSIPADITLSSVQTRADWQQKLEIHLAATQGPDGHVNDPYDWLAMERQKCRIGAMKSYLIHSQGNLCGTVGTMDMGNLLRLKNLVIHPDWRQQGIGVKTVEAVKRLAVTLGRQRMGCFALAGGVGERTYRKANLHAITQQTEWYKLLKPILPT